VRREEDGLLDEHVAQRSGPAPRAPERHRRDGAARLRRPLGGAEAVLREAREEPLDLRAVAGGEDDQGRRRVVRLRPRGVDERHRGAPPCVHAGVGEGVGIERVEAELGREGAPGAGEVARAGEAGDGGVEGGEGGGGAAGVRDDQERAGGRGDEPLRGGAAPPAVAREGRERGEDREDGRTARAAKHVLSLPW
jgi:hypothetical protein